MTDFTPGQRRLYDEILQIVMQANDITQSDLQGILEVIVKNYKVEEKNIIYQTTISGETVRCDYSKKKSTK